MFRSVNGVLNKKLDKIVKSNNASTSIKDSFGKFVKDQFGPLAQKIKYTLDYDSKNNSLIVKTENKILANELSLRKDSILESFKKDRFKLSQIIIR